MIDFSRPDGQTAPGYLATPAAGDRAPALVVIEEWWGVNDQIKRVADQYAAAGYRALVPDLFRGRVAADDAEANHLMSGLDFSDAATQDVAGALAHLKKAGGKAGVAGYCMGGALALLAAMHGAPADAVVSFYGYPPAEAGDPAAIAVPVLCHAAERDGFFTLPGYEAIERKMKAAERSIELYRYAAEHAFCNPDAPPKGLGHYKPELAKLAWDRTIAFLKRHL
ncbi:MAG: dienelactone hydrolase family protein [Vulcanimicrobiaceae bacterium]